MIGFRGGLRGRMRGGAGEGGRCGRRAEADGLLGFLQGLGRRRADYGGVGTIRDWIVSYDKLIIAISILRRCLEW